MLLYKRTHSYIHTESKVNVISEVRVLSTTNAKTVLIDCETTNYGNVIEYSAKIIYPGKSYGILG
jgi:hypothetical protein